MELDTSLLSVQEGLLGEVLRIIALFIPYYLTVRGRGNNERVSKPLSIKIAYIEPIGLGSLDKEVRHL